MATDRLSFMAEELQTQKDAGLYINIRQIESPAGAWMKVDGKRVLNLCTNNYLGLANDSRLKEAAKAAVDRWGVGPAAVRTIAGTLSLHRELEERLAAFKGAEAALYLQSGFCANQAAIPNLVGKQDVIFSDRLNHASIIDGCRLSGAKVIVYEHNDPTDADRVISENLAQFRRGLLVTDGVFSMDGDVAPLDKLYEVAARHGVLTMVDDAHGEGVLGRGGRGIVDHFGLHGQVDVEMGTLSKAFGVVGGFLAGKALVVEYLRQRARPTLFSSAVTAADTAACLAAVDVIEGSPELVERLWQNTRYFKAQVAGMGLDIGHSETPITPIMLGETVLAKTFSRRLFEEGVFAMALGFPTVPRGMARIRAMMSAALSTDDIDYGLERIRNVGHELGII